MAPPRPDDVTAPAGRQTSSSATAVASITKVATGLTDTGPKHPHDDWPMITRYRLTPANAANKVAATHHVTARYHPDNSPRPSRVSTSIAANCQRGDANSAYCGTGS